MRAYIDKANLDSFLRSRRNNPEDFDMCLKMLSRELDVYLDITEKEFRNDPLCQIWVKKLSMKGYRKPFCEKATLGEKSPLQKRPIVCDSDFYDNFKTIEHHSAIYMIKDAYAETLDKQGAYIVSSKGKELQTLTALFCQDEQYYKYLDVQEYFKGTLWGVLSDYVRPCTDIIIADSYLLTYRRRIMNNLAKLLLKLSSTKSTTTKVNVVIFVFDKTETKDNEGNIIKVFIPDWEGIRKEISDLFGKHGKFINLSFVAVKKEVLKEHDRTVFTNYMQYIPGACLNFYDEDGKLLENDRHFHIHSLAKKDHYDAALRFLSKLQGVINKIKENPEEGKLYLDSDKNISNYLSF